MFALLGQDAETKKYAGIAREQGLAYFYTADLMVDLANGRLADAVVAWTAGLEAWGHDADLVAMVVEASARPELVSSTLEYLGRAAGPAREQALALLFLRQYDVYLSDVEADRFLLLWSPLARPARQLPSFHEVLAKARILDYWRDRGWPDLLVSAMAHRAPNLP